jgi:pyruvate/2-oxoacid:ferredoxin oxidoreductase beta subunit
MKKRIPVEDYLSVQGRFRKITAEETVKMQQMVEDTIVRLQREVDGIC